MNTPQINCIIGICFFVFLILLFLVPMIRKPNKKWYNLHENTNNKKELKLLLFGDYGTKGLFGQKHLAKKLAIYAEQFKPDFLIGTGDNLYRNGANSSTSINWKKSIESIYFGKYKELLLPWYNVLGNHDYRNDPSNQLKYSKNSIYWKLPRHYYTINYLIGSAKIQFFYIDTNLYSNKVKNHQKSSKYYKIYSFMRKKQLLWLENELYHSKAKWKFVVGHHPLIVSENDDELFMLKKFEKVFKKYKIDLYLSGHKHILEVLKPFKHLKTLQVVSGSASTPSAIKPRKVHKNSIFLKDKTLGFCSVSIREHDYQIKIINQGGVVIYNLIVSKQ